MYKVHGALIFFPNAKSGDECLPQPYKRYLVGCLNKPNKPFSIFQEMSESFLLARLVLSTIITNKLQKTQNRTEVEIDDLT